MDCKIALECYEKTILDLLLCLIVQICNMYCTCISSLYTPVYGLHCFIYELSAIFLRLFYSMPTGYNKLYIFFIYMWCDL